MRPIVLHTSTLFAAFALSACSADALSSEEASGVGADVGGDKNVHLGSDSTIEPDVPDVPDAEIPNVIEPPGGLEFADLVTNDKATCGIAQGRVHCWGDNSTGVAQPPEDDLRADRVVLAPSYACAVGSLIGIVCWGDGADAVLAADDATFISQFALYGASANADMVCQSIGYAPWTARITCYGDESSWMVGPEGAVAVDVTYGKAKTNREATICYAYTIDGGYAYRCEHGGTPIEVTESRGEWSGRFPTIRYDGNDEVAVLMADGDVQWFDLNLHELGVPPNDGIYQASRLSVDWGEWRMDFDESRADQGNPRRSNIQLLSTDYIFYRGYMLLARRYGGSDVALITRRSATRAAVYPPNVDITYCFDSECYVKRR